MHRGLLLLLWLCPGPGMTQVPEWRMNMLPESRIAVMGSSNVNEFTFWYKETIPTDHAFEASLKAGTFQFERNRIVLKVRGFDSGNQIMNSDFLKMMNEPRYPHFEVALVSFFPRWKSDSTWSEGEAEISVTINGKTTLLRASGQRMGSGLFISGSPTLSLKQFELTAPTRMMGLVKVNDAVEVVLILHFAAP